MEHMMGLTTAAGPFGERPQGRFDFDPPERVRYIEPCPRRVRAEKDGATVADSGEHDDLAWSYEEPRWDGERVRNRIAFFNERTDIEVDGVPQERPVTQFSR
jgi:uncharacterized protein (DUF427 family)